MADRLNGYRILILETREEAQFSHLLSEQGADVLQCPMFAIHDAPNPAPIEATSKLPSQPWNSIFKTLASVPPTNEPAMPTKRLVSRP